MGKLVRLRFTKGTQVLALQNALRFYSKSSHNAEWPRKVYPSGLILIMCKHLQLEEGLTSYQLNTS